MNMKLILKTLKPTKYDKFRAETITDVLYKED